MPDIVTKITSEMLETCMIYQNWSFNLIQHGERRKRPCPYYRLNFSQSDLAIFSVSTHFIWKMSLQKVVFSY